MAIVSTVSQAWKRLSDIGLGDIHEAGGKAARLGQLAGSGFPVPDGFVLLASICGRIDEARPAVRAGLASLGAGRFAVRSSGVAEDLAEASFAGQYETVLGVDGEHAVIEAVRRCWDSARSERVHAYSRQRAGGGTGPMAVLVQRLVNADAAGVAYSANPVTGDRDEAVVSAVKGLGERLVAGEAAPDEWSVRAEVAYLTAQRESAIDAVQALGIARLARKVADELGAPQDIEWAIADGRLYLLQARPITALPEAVSWESPVGGAFARHFRFGEWIGDPVTPLFESWLLSRLEDGLHAEFKEWTGLTIPHPYHVTVNGWYFYVLPDPKVLLRFLPAILGKLLTQPRKVVMMLPPAAHFGIELFIKEWRVQVLPGHLRTIDEAEAQLEDAPQGELIALIDRLALESGIYFASVTAVAGFAAKAEHPLAVFYRRHLDSRIGGSHLALLQGLVERIGVDPHAVQSLDWYFPTLGELGLAGGGGTIGLRDRLASARIEAETRARAALAGEPKLLRQFDKLLATAQRFQPLREENVSHLTRGWPLMRRALQRLAGPLVEKGALADVSDVYFLTRNELVAALANGSATIAVAERRTAWERRRRLSPPLVVGRVSPMAEKMLNDFAEAMRTPAGERSGLRGVPASPGRASGPARVIRDASEFDRLRPGDVLVAHATTPAWTPLFARAAAVVTDTGSIGSHASQVAREYGIPAVVCIGEATGRLRDDQPLTVDGSAGLVEFS
jgi:rifampicin phosphotransferase